MTEAVSPAELWGFGLVAARVLPSGFMLGVLSRAVVPFWIGIGVSLALAAGLSFQVQVGPLLHAGHHALLFAILRELCLGAAFAAAAAVPWLSLSFSVRTLDALLYPAGASLSRFYLLAALAVSLALGGHRAYVGALSASLHEVPVGQSIVGRAAWLSETLRSLEAALGLTLAVGISLWMSVALIELTLALLVRAFGGSERLNNSSPRSALALFVCALLLAPLSARAPEWVRTWSGEARAIVQRLSR